jgi:hypothetical protein
MSVAIIILVSRVSVCDAQVTSTRWNYCPSGFWLIFCSQEIELTWKGCFQTRTNLLCDYWSSNSTSSRTFRMAHALCETFSLYNDRR